MAVFEFRGVVVATGKAMKGIRDADNPKALRALLKREGILLTDAVEGKQANANASKRVNFLAMFTRITVSDLSSMTRQLATLVRAGIPLVDSMTALTEQTEKEELLRVLTQVRDRLNEGLSLAKCLEQHPKVFPPIYTNMVAAGEASGTLDKVLERLADFLEAQANLQSKVSGALAYPILMMVMGGGLLVVMMTLVVPKVTSIFASLDRALPWYTEVLIATSNALSSPVTGGMLLGLALYQLGRRTLGPRMPGDNALPAFQIVGVIVTLFAVLSGFYVDSVVSYLIGMAFGAVLGFAVGRYQLWVATPRGQIWKDTTLLRVPIFGTILRLAAVARFTRTLGTLLQSGVSLLKSMEIVRNVVDNARMREVVEAATESIREGQSISLPLKRSKEFPPMAIHMITVGEKSGQLEQMLETVAKEYDRQVENSVSAMTSLLTPLVMVVMGGGVGFITFAILMPLIQMNDFVE
jgi:general secretion pathway protein F